MRREEKRPCRTRGKRIGSAPRFGRFCRRCKKRRREGYRRDRWQGSNPSSKPYRCDLPVSEPPSTPTSPSQTDLTQQHTQHQQNTRFFFTLLCYFLLSLANKQKPSKVSRDFPRAMHVPDTRKSFSFFFFPSGNGGWACAKWNRKVFIVVYCRHRHQYIYGAD